MTPRLQELHISYGGMDGSFLSTLADHCSLLRVLRLNNVSKLTFARFEALPQLMDLATLKLHHVQLDAKSMHALGCNLPPNLQTLSLRGQQAFTSQGMVNDKFLSNQALAAFIDALPLPASPLRCLTLLRQMDAPCTHETLAVLLLRPTKLACLERVDLGETVATA